MDKHDVILSGDFNVNLLGDSSTAKDFLTIITTNGCVNAINKPTRITASTQSLIDLFITNFDCNRFMASVIACDLSDHFQILSSVKTKIKTTPVNRHLFRCITENSLAAFRLAIANVDWSDVATFTGADMVSNHFFERFIDIYNRHFPYKTYNSAKKARKEWVTATLLRKIRIKDRMFRKFLNSRDIELFTKFKLHRNKLNKELRQARESYYYTMFKSCHSN